MDEASVRDDEVPTSVVGERQSVTTRWAAFFTGILRLEAQNILQRVLAVLDADVPDIPSPRYVIPSFSVQQSTQPEELQWQWQPCHACSFCSCQSQRGMHDRLGYFYCERCWQRFPSPCYVFPLM